MDNIRQEVKTIDVISIESFDEVVDEIESDITDIIYMLEEISPHSKDDDDVEYEIDEAIKCLKELAKKLY